MQITCKCLNVIIETKGQTYEIIDEALRNILGSDAFFKEDVATVNLPSITKKLPSLVESYMSGPWVIHRCLNCNIFTYAYNKETGKNTIIVRSSLITDAQEIAALQESEMFSPVFKVVISSDNINTGATMDKDIIDQKMHTVLDSWVEEQTALTEERVQAYMDKEYAALEKLKARAHRDYEALSRKVTVTNKVQSSRKPASNPRKSIFSINGKKEVKKVMNVKLSSNGSSFDSEGLFTLDDIEDNETDQCFEEENSSNESDINEDQLQRRYGFGQFARSLPVPVPQFMQEKNHSDSNSGSPQVPTDIAASIKALAKSVHGDTVFGELPRPRFSTHL